MAARAAVHVLICLVAAAAAVEEANEQNSTCIAVGKHCSVTFITASIVTPKVQCIPCATGGGPANCNVVPCADDNDCDGWCNGPGTRHGTSCTCYLNASCTDGAPGNCLNSTSHAWDGSSPVVVKAGYMATGTVEDKPVYGPCMEMLPDEWTDDNGPHDTVMVASKAACCAAAAAAKTKAGLAKNWWNWNPATSGNGTCDIWMKAPGVRNPPVPRPEYQHSMSGWSMPPAPEACCPGSTCFRDDSQGYICVHRGGAGERGAGAGVGGAAAHGGAGERAVQVPHGLW